MSAPPSLSSRPPAWIAAGLLFLAVLGRWPYGFYTFLRWVVCATAAFVTLRALERGRQGWVWSVGLITLLFNPLIPVHLDRATWQLFDLMTAIVLPVGAWWVERVHN